MVENTASVVFKCADGELIDVPVNLALDKFGENFKNMITEAAAKGEEVSVPKIKKPCMAKVIEWCTNFIDKEPHIIEPPLCHSDLKMVIDEWSANWIGEFEKDDLF